MRSDAKTVEAYLEALPADRAAALGTVRSVILEHLPDGYEETMAWGMIAYVIPTEWYADTSNGQPLMYAALASQKHHMAVYLIGIYDDDAERRAFETAYRTTGKRYDVGKSCVRFRKLDDLPLDVIGDAIAAVSVEEMIERAERARTG